MYGSLTNHSVLTSEAHYHAAAFGSDGYNEAILVAGELGLFIVIHTYDKLFGFNGKFWGRMQMLVLSVSADKLLASSMVRYQYWRRMFHIQVIMNFLLPVLF